MVLLEQLRWSFSFKSECALQVPGTNENFKHAASVHLHSCLTLCAHDLRCNVVCRIGQPFAGPQELHKLFQQYDTNSSVQLEFNEFIVLFKDRLRDLRRTLANISMKPAKSKATTPSLIEVRWHISMNNLCFATPGTNPEMITALCYILRMTSSTECRLHLGRSTTSIAIRSLTMC